MICWPRMVPISAYYLGQEPPNLAQLRKTIGWLLHQEDQLENGAGAEAAPATDSTSPAAHSSPHSPENSSPQESQERERSSETVTPHAESTLAQHSGGISSAPLPDDAVPSPSEQAQLPTQEAHPYSSATHHLTESMEEVNLSSSPGLHGRSDSQDLPTDEIDLS